ncbi:MAG: ribonuclease HII [Candidatus Bathyarchaeota archaeon]|nr:ribonuclease HII [Candidatus Bathyarchaeum tardum]WGM88630.1 MAG: ribonuclease HII [Candidatus Bathyarchaeum tardum]WNZ29114.1 MAG: ribonuclease HII [Candidatus Bathyarchaeota archaeon]
MRLAGVDEAGRGCVIGPLVVGGVSIDETDLPKLVEIGVKDSKLLAPKKREILARQIREIALNCYVVHLSPVEIDHVVETGKRLHKLNRFEAQTMAKVISVLNPDVVYVDASDVNAKRFGEHIAENLVFRSEIISEHKADLKYPVVSAASIIAKVERDKVISKLIKKHGNLGCGYPNDQKTTNFLRDWIKKYGSYPDFVRKSWKTSKKIKKETDLHQTKLL